MAVIPDSTQTGGVDSYVRALGAITGKHAAQQRFTLDTPAGLNYSTRSLAGAIAQLGERNTGSVEVGGSIPPGSTNLVQCPHRLEA